MSRTRWRSISSRARRGFRRRRARSRCYTATMTALDEMRRRLDAIPDPQLTADPAVEPAIADSVRYLASDDAMRSLDADVYWPKWTSPWWHMVLLFEMGEARRIPERASAKMAAALAAFKLKIFPIHD